MLSSKKKTDNNEDFKTKKQYDSLLEKKSETQELIDVNDRKILDVKNKIQINKEQQQKIDFN